MRDEHHELRRRLFFETEPAAFPGTCRSVRRELEARHARGTPQDQAAIEALAAELCLDMQSYLPRWNLRRPDAAVRVETGLLQEEAAAFRSLLAGPGAEAQRRRVAAEEALLKRSNFLRLSQLADAGTIRTRWGYDYAYGIRAAMRRGAVLVTTNPPLVNLARKEQPDVWEPVRAELRRTHPGADRGLLAALFSARVVLDNARLLRPVYEASGGRYGHVNLQVNPRAAQDPERMAAEAELLHAVLSEHLGGAPNVVFKIPGTRAGLEAARRVTGRGIGVTITLGFSVDQHAAFGEAIEHGSAPVSFLVMMNGRLDDPVCEELQNAGVPEAAETARWAATAVVRRSYRHVFREMGCRRSSLLIASLRGPWNVASAITAGPAPVFLTSFPDKTEEYDAEPREIRSEMEEPVPAPILDRLRRSRIFRRAFEPGELGVDGFDTYEPVQATLRAFGAAWDELGAWMAG